MVTLCTVSATTSQGGSAVDVEARGAETGGTGYYLADVEATVDASIYEALRPRGGVQRVGLRLYVDNWPEIGETLRLDPYLVGGWSLTRSMGAAAQAAQFQVAANGSPPVLGSQANTPGMLTYGRHWNVALAYRYGDDGTREFPLMTFGHIDSSERSDSGPVVDSVRVVDRMFFGQSVPATVQLPAGHGLSYWQAVAKLFQAHGGDPATPVGRLPRVPSDLVFRKEVNLIKGNAVQLAGALGDLLGTVYFVDEEGFYSGAIYAPEQERGPVMGVIDERDILVAVDGQFEAFTIRPMPAPPTHVCFSGTIQHVRTTEGTRNLPKTHPLYRPPEPRRQSLELPSQSFATFAPRVARYVTTGTGTASTDTGITETVREGLHSETLSVIDMDYDTMVGKQTATKGWHNLSAARYTINSSLALTQIAGVYIAEQTPGAQANAWNEERYIPLTFSTQSRAFDTSGNLKSEVFETWAIHHARRAIQSRPNLNTAWENTGSAPGIPGFALGNGEGVVNARASLQLIERRLVDHGATNGYQTFKRTRTYAFDVADGWQYRYGDGSTSSDAQETFRKVSDMTEHWLPLQGREDQHAYLMRNEDGNGNLIDGKDELLSGYLPVAEERDDLEPQREDFDSDAEWRLALGASKHGNQPMHAELHDDAALNVLGRARIDLEATYEHAALPWQLENAAKRLFIKGRARVVSFSVPPNPLFRIGQWWRVRNRKPGIDVDHDGIILDSQFEQRGNRGAIVQRLSVAIH